MESVERGAREKILERGGGDAEVLRVAGQHAVYRAAQRKRGATWILLENELVWGLGKHGHATYNTSTSKVFS